MSPGRSARGTPCFLNAYPASQQRRRSRRRQHSLNQNSGREAARRKNASAEASMMSRQAALLQLCHQKRAELGVDKVLLPRAVGGLAAQDLLRPRVLLQLRV